MLLFYKLLSLLDLLDLMIKIYESLKIYTECEPVFRESIDLQSLFRL